MKYLLVSARSIVEDLLGTFTFYALYLLTGSARTAAIAGLAVGLVQIVIHVIRRRPLPGLLLIGVALTFALGIMTIFTQDARFVLIKPSIVYTAIGIAMLKRGWVTRYVPAIAIELLPVRTWDRVGWAWAGIMLATAVINLGLVALLPPTHAAAIFAVFVLVSKLALFGGQYWVLRRAAGRAYRARQAAQTAA